jgi:hypothetical protein
MRDPTPDFGRKLILKAHIYHTMMDHGFPPTNPTQIQMELSITPSHIPASL